MRRLIAGAVVVVMLAGCWQQLQIDFSIDNTGTYRNGVMTLSGTLICANGSPGVADGEPLDMFTTITQYPHSFSEELHDSCSRDRKRWTETFAAPGFGPGRVSVRMTVCTNPSQHVDEDCVTVERAVTLS